MNKKGFTVVELMTTFVLVAVISTLLIKLVVTLKEIYITGDMKTALITKQSTMTDKIYKDLNKNNLTKIEKCGTSNCVSFVYTTGTKKFVIDKDNKTITYDNYTIKLGKEGSLGDASIENYTSDIGSILSFKVPIHNRLLKGDFGINITYQLNDEIDFDNDIVFDVQDTGLTVTFDANDGSSEKSKKQVTNGELYGKLPNASKDGYEFVGWSAIPPEYQQVEYIQSTGTQYIDTEYKPTPKTGVEVDYQFTDLTVQQRVYGATASASSGYINQQFYINGNAKWAYAFIDGGGNWVTTNIDADKYRHKWSINVNDNKWRYDNYSHSIADSTRTTASNWNLYLMASSNDSDSPTGQSKIKIYSFKIYEDGKLVRNFVPAYKKSDTTIGLYETIEGKFYINKGTGTFTKGKDGSTNDVSIIDPGTKVTRNANHTLTAVYAKKYQITNLVKNGSFENDLNNWEKYNYLDPSATIHTSNTLYKKFGNKSIERLSNDTNSKNLIAQSIHFIEGHKYYYFLSGYTNSTTSQRISSDVNSRSNSNITFNITKQVGWVKGSVIYTSEATEDRNISINCAVTTDKTYVDGVGIVDLTDAFGVDNEPSLEWCNENINYFNGSKVILK